MCDRHEFGGQNIDCGRQNNDFAKDVHVLILPLPTYKHKTYYDKRDFSDEIKLKIWGWGDYTDYLGGPSRHQGY